VDRPLVIGLLARGDPLLIICLVDVKQAHITGWHDNTANNKYNPNPRNWVGYGQRTIDEMSFAWVSLFYIDEADYQQRIAARKKTND